MTDHSSTKFITGLRGYAALGVFLIHSGGMGIQNLGIFGQRLVDFGKYGVVVFFVVSAFTISMSIDASPNFSFPRYLLQRFLRIAPLYYFVLIAGFLLGGNTFYQTVLGSHNDVRSLILHMLFVNFNVEDQNNILGVEWTVPIEFAYYIIIPFLIFLFNRNRHSVLLVLIFSWIISSMGFLLYSNSAFPVESYNWSIVKYFFTFVFGVAVYLIYRSNWSYLEGFRYLSLLQALILLGIGIVIILDFGNKDFVVTIVVGLTILLCKYDSLFKRWIFQNRLILYLGNISFSFYLFHILFFHHLAKSFLIFKNPLIVLISTIVVSSITYYFMERPYIELGKRKIIAT